MLFEMLPLLEGWSYQWIRRTGKVKVGEGTKEIDKVEGRGFFFYSSAELRNSLDAKYCKFIIEIDGPGTPFTIIGDFEDLHRVGYTFSLPFGVVLTKYSDSDKLYNAIATLGKPMPFVKRTRLLLQPPAAPVDEPGVTEIEYEISAGIVTIEDLELFRDGIRYIFGTERLLPELRPLMR